ncbi:hypothetical protein JYU34_000168 [Plutella xylostella]|uniref:Uncharacterized protein n=1 Tax=Plutella xylostella TaxID=51655 RepID=A0ABQ7R717_PLUXY|nr:hypothetical protein JYU34_000168 [Plutella xylostella]
MHKMNENLKAAGIFKMHQSSLTRGKPAAGGGGGAARGQRLTWREVRGRVAWSRAGLRAGAGTPRAGSMVAPRRASSWGRGRGLGAANDERKRAAKVGVAPACSRRLAPILKCRSMRSKREPRTTSSESPPPPAPCHRASPRGAPLPRAARPTPPCAARTIDPRAPSAVAKAHHQHCSNVYLFIYMMTLRSESTS